MLNFRAKIILYIFPLILTGCYSSGRNAEHIHPFTYLSGAIVRGDTLGKSLALVFTGDEYAEGGEHILGVLERQGIPASFFLTGKFYRNPGFESLIRNLVAEDHYLGAHSDRHLLYCDWEKRDSLLLTKNLFVKDLEDNYRAMAIFGIKQSDAPLFLPPYEWHNDTIASWTREMGLTLINMTHGTLSHADYTLPGTEGYWSSKAIYNSILEHEINSANGLNGFILLSHVGTSPERSDKFYLRLEELIRVLKDRGYSFKRIDSLLVHDPQQTAP